MEHFHILRAHETDSGGAPGTFASLEGAILIGQVLCLPVAGENAHFHYLPLTAGLQRNPDGSVQAQLFAAGSTAFLQVATVWGPDAETLEAVRAELARRQERDPPLPVRLSFAPVTAVGARLMVHDASGEMRDIARSQGSGMPPYSALFNLTLDAADQPAAKAALNGQTGNLSVVYAAMLVWPGVHRARLTGKLARIHDRAELDAALADGQAQLDLPAESGDLIDAFLDRAVELLQVASIIDDGAETTIDIELTVEKEVPLTAATDLGTWFETRDAPITVTPTPKLPDLMGREAPEEIRVAIGFEAFDEVVAMVELEADGQTAHLMPDSPVAMLNRDAAAPGLSVSTSFRAGGAPFRTHLTLTAGEDVTLGPAELGLALVRIDPTPFAAAGFDRARVTVRYRPEASHQRALKTFRFRAPFEPAQWPVVTRGTPLGKSLTYEVSASGPDGARLRLPETVSASPDIVLNPDLQNED